MAFFKINNIDFSKYVNELEVCKEHNYNAQKNAAGDTVVDHINAKRSIKVGIIPLDSAAMKALQSAIDGFSVSLSFLNPNTNSLENNVACIIPSNDVSYYTIQANRVKFKAFTLEFTEL